MGHVPTSVVIVTGLDEQGTPHGITIGSFVSVSLEPPLVGFFPGLNSRSWSAIRSSGRFCVNVLGAAHEEICWRFAKEGDDRFAGVPWSAAPGGGPLIEGSIAWIDCAIASESTVGDHCFVVGNVEAMGAADGVADAMVFFRGKVTSAVHRG
jgi:flavin reductase (DIM6/NTAB) family NADH-FMN oxidoreductase RutF